MTRASSSSLHGALRAAYDAAVADWPGVVVDAKDFARALSERLPEGGVLEGLEALRASEVYLVCACARRDPTALALLEQRYFAKVRGAVSRHLKDAAAVDDVVQALRERLFARQPPAIGTFGGRGPLQSWLCAAAVRQALDFARANRRLVPRGDDAALEGGVGGDHELDFIRARHAADFRVALQEAFAQLSPEERRLLRFAHVDGLTVDRIASLQQVPRSTAARQVVRARTQLIALTRSALKQNLHLSDAGLESLVRVVRADLDLSLSALGKSRR